MVMAAIRCKYTNNELITNIFYFDCAAPKSVDLALMDLIIIFCGFKSAIASAVPREVVLVNMKYQNMMIDTFIREFSPSQRCYKVDIHRKNRRF